MEHSLYRQCFCSRPITASHGRPHLKLNWLEIPLPPPPHSHNRHTPSNEASQITHTLLSLSLRSGIAHIDKPHMQTQPAKPPKQTHTQSSNGLPGGGGPAPTVKSWPNHCERCTSTTWPVVPLTVPPLTLPHGTTAFYCIVSLHIWVPTRGVIVGDKHINT